MSSYYLIGTGSGGGRTVKLYELADTQPEVRNFPILSFAETAGEESSNLYRPHLPFEFQFKIQDIGNHYFYKLKGAKPDDFKVEVTGDGDIMTGFVVSNAFDHEYWRSSGSLPVICNDGVSNLRGIANTFEERERLGDLLYNLLEQTGLSLPLNFILNRQYPGAAGQGDIIPNQYRIDPQGFLNEIENPTAHDLLFRLLEFWKLQLWQQAGEWWIANRKERGGATVSYFRQDGSGWTSETIAPQVTLDNASLRSKNTRETTINPIATITRTSDFRVFEHQIINNSFTLWENGEAVGWSGIGAVNQLNNPSSMQFADRDVERSQRTFRVLYSGDQLALNVKLKYYRKASIPDGSYTVKLFMIRAVSNDGYTLYLRPTGEWTSTETWFADSFSVISNGHETEKSLQWQFDADAFVAPNFYAYAEIILALDDPDEVSTDVNPIEYDVANLPAIDLRDPVTERKFLISNPSAYYGQELSEEIYNDTYSRYYQLPDVEYYDGLKWLPATDFDDVSADEQGLQELVLEEHMSAQLSPRDSYILTHDPRLEFTMNDVILFAPNGVEKKFLPQRIYLKKEGSETVRQITIAEYNYEPPPPAGWTYPDLS